MVFKAFKWVGGLLLGGLIAAVVLGGLFTGWPITRGRGGKSAGVRSTGR